MSLIRFRAAGFAGCVLIAILLAPLTGLPAVPPPDSATLLQRLQDLMPGETLDLGGSPGAVPLRIASAEPIVLRGTLVCDGALTLSSPAGIEVGPQAKISARQLVLEAPRGVVRIAGTIDASSSTARGGDIRILGRHIDLSPTTRLNADGATGGGLILIGGDYRGENPAVVNADRTGIAAGARITANALQSGSGGRVIVWADEFTRFHGAIAARGGVSGGDGGFVEVSGKGHLAFRGDIDLLAPAGAKGELLLDPADLIIAAAGPNLNGDTVTGDDIVGNIWSTDYPGASSVITAGQVAALLGSVDLTLAATSSITVNSAISWSSSRTLTLDTSGSIAINAAITNSGTGGVTLRTRSTGTIYLGANIATAGIATLDAGGAVSVSTGTVTAANLYLRGTGNVGSSAVPLATNTDLLILAKNSGDAFVRDASVIYLQGSTGGSLSVEALTGAVRGGDSPLLVGGTATFAAGSGTTDFVSVWQTGNSFASTVSARAGGYVWLGTSGNLSLGSVTAGSSIDITFSGALNLVGSALSGTSIRFAGQGASDRIVGPIYTSTLSGIENYASTNLVTDSDFETSSLTVGDALATAGAWFGDANDLVTAQGGVTPFSGSRMLKFVRTAADSTTNSTSSDATQLIDLSGSGTLLQDGTGNLLAAARFNRVAGTASTDRQFRITLRAFTGPLANHTAAAVPLAETTTTLTSDADPATWETLTAALILPANTTYATLTVSAFEDVTNDAPPTAEFAGHYADALRAGLGRAQAQTLTVSSPGDLPQTLTPLTLTATSSVALPVTLSVVSGPATVFNRILTLTGDGTVVLRASQPGTGLVAPAIVERTLAVVPSAQVLYATKFANFPGIEIVGVDGWTGTHPTGAASGIFTPSSPRVPTGFIGFDAVSDATVTLRRPVSFNPATASVPQVNFSAEISFVPATNFRRDAYAFRVVNLSGETLAQAVFDTGNMRITVTNPDGTLNNTPVGTFAYNTPYALRFALNLGSNRWSVWLDSTPLWVNQPITSLGRALTLRDVALDWKIATPGSPGDGYLALSGYSLWSDKGFQVISFTPPSTLINYTTTPILLAATSTSGLPVTFTVVSGPATITGGNLTLTGTGTVVVRAAQAGNSTTQAATPVDHTLTVLPAGFQIGAAASTRPIMVTEPGDWTASTTAPWITLPVAAGTGQRLLDVSFAANTTGADRSTTLTIGGTPYSITQRAAGSGLRELWAVGYDSVGELGLGHAPTPRVTPTLVATGMQSAAPSLGSAYFLGNDGTLWGTGDNAFSDLGLGDAYPRASLQPIAKRVTQVVAPSNGSAVFFITDDGTLWATGYPVSNPTPVATGVAQVAHGGSFSAYVKTDGTLWTAGNNYAGQLGDGTNTSRSNFAQVATGVAAVSCGSAHLAYIKTDGTLWTVGSNGVGQLGTGNQTSRNTAGQIATGVASVSAGTYHTAYVKTDGTLWAHGDNSSAQLGDGTNTTRLSPVQIGTGFARVYCGSFNTFAVKSGATSALWVTGGNFGMFGDGTTNARLTLTPHPTITAARQVTYAHQRTLFTLTDGRVLATGYTGGNSLANGGVMLHNSNNDGAADYRRFLTPVATGVASVLNRANSGATGYCTMMLGTDGVLSGIGVGYWGQFGDGLQPSTRRTPYQIATGVRSFSIGGYHALYVKADNTLWGMGLNDTGALGTGNTTDRFTPLQLGTGVATASAGLNHTVILKTDGTLWTVGSNSVGQLGDGTTTSFRTTPVQVASGVASASSWGFTTLFVKTDGTLWGFGYNSAGELGDGTTTMRRSPIQIATGVTAAWAGVASSFFLKTDGTLWGMGWNFYGQLGDGTTTNRTTPVQIATNVASASPSSYYTLFLKTDGTAWAMGYNNYGQLGDGTTTDRTTPVQIATNAISVSAGSVSSFIIGTDQVPLTTPSEVLRHPGSVTLAAGSSTSLSVLVAGNPAPTYQWFKDGLLLPGATSSSLALENITAGNTGTYTVRVSNPLSGFFSNPATVAIASGFDAWRLANFPADAAANPAVSGPLVVGPGGLSNLVLYALGLDATGQPAGNLPASGVLGDDWTYTYTRPGNRSDVTYAVEYSTNLTSWQTSGITTELVADNGTLQTHRARVPKTLAPTTIFFRLRVTR